MAVQHFDHKQAQDVFSGQGGDQHRERPSIVCRAFMGVFLVGWRLLYKWRPGAGGCCIIGRVFRDRGKPKSVTGKARSQHKRDLGPLSTMTGEPDPPAILKKLIIQGFRDVGLDSGRERRMEAKFKN